MENTDDIRELNKNERKDCIKCCIVGKPSVKADYQIKFSAGGSDISIYMCKDCCIERELCKN